ncbi:MAG TPA: hypothetical protein VGK90_04805 [Rhizomicrobium sp.]|jgi:hypothetical protein
MPARTGNRLLKTGLFIVMWVAALEVLTRLFMVSPSNVVPDPALGYMYAPNSTVRIESADAGFRRASFNALGLNDWPLRADDHRPRVLVLGDSYVEALQVDRPENFIGILGRERPALRFVNGGRSGLDPVTEYLMLRKLAPLVNPAAIIMVENLGDRTDLLADGITIERCRNSNEICNYHSKPVPEISRTGLVGLARESALVTFVARRLEEPVRQFLAGIRQWRSRPAVFAESSPPGERYTDGDFEPLLACIFRNIASHYKLIIAAVPDTDFEPAGKSEIPDGGKFQRDVERAANAVGAGYFDAAPVLETLYRQTGQPPRGFAFSQPGHGHLNADGHAALAHGLENQIDALGLKVAR